jgi:hypothetical protein
MVDDESSDYSSFMDGGDDGVAVSHSSGEYMQQSQKGGIKTPLD